MSDEKPPIDNFEQQFLTAVLKGEVSEVNHLLDKQGELDLNINCRDASGKTALRIAITEGNLVVIYPLLESRVHIGDSLLRAVDCDFVEAVRLLCQYAKEQPSPKERMSIIDCHCENDDFHPDVTPVVLASQKNNFTMIQMLVEAGARIPEMTADTFQTAATDSLQQSVGSLEIYKGMASEGYVVLSSDDPINRCFTLCNNLRKLSEIEVEFKMPYLELLDRMGDCSRELIGQARSTEEILTILTAHDTSLTANGKRSDAKFKGPLPKISRAIELEQRKFIASPNCQQAVISQFYRRLIYLRDKHILYRVMFFCVMLLMHPILAIIFLYVPSKKVREFVTTPYIKFILYIGSDLLLVACLTTEAVLDEGTPYMPSLFQPYKTVISVWIFGLACKEVNIMRGREAKTKIVQWHHIRDISIVICFLYAIIFDAIAYSQMKESKGNTQSTSDELSRSTRDASATITDHLDQADVDSLPLAADSLQLNGSRLQANVSAYTVFVNSYTSRRRVGGRTKNSGKVGQISQDNIVDEGGVLTRDWTHPQLLARSLFALATVVSIARIYPYLVVSDVVGPLKISLGSMVQKTSHFFLVVSLVLLSFAVGLTYIYAYYNKAALLKCKSKPDESASCAQGDFKDLVTSLITLYWSIFGLNPMEVLQLPDNAHMLETAGMLMYAMFYVFVVVVLLNALIAVMSQVYTEVEENADVEWKFSCTAMWMGFMEDDDPLPPPYNLLPGYVTLKSICGRMVQPYRWKTDREKLMASSKQSERDLTKTFIEESKKRLDERSKDSRYKKIMALLVERYVTEKTSGESSTTAEVTASDIRGLKNDLIALRYETFLKMCKTHDYLVHVAEDCLGIHGQSRGTNVIFKKTDKIETIVQHHAKTVYDFHVKLHETISRMPPPPTPPPDPEPAEPSSKIMKLIRYYDKSVTPRQQQVRRSSSSRDLNTSSSGDDGDSRYVLTEAGRRLTTAASTVPKSASTSVLESASDDGATALASSSSS